MITVGIEWKQARLKIIGAGGKEGYEHPELKLLPGVNIVDRKVWRAIRENKMPALEAMIDSADLEEVKSADGDDDLDQRLPRGASASLKMIASTFLLAQLEKWRASEERPPVRAAIDRQIAEVQDTKRESDSAEE